MLFLSSLALLAGLVACGGGQPTMAGEEAPAATPTPTPEPMPEPATPPPPSVLQAGITLLAGSIGGPGHLDGTGEEARFEQVLAGMSRDAAGNLYVASNSTIRRITPQRLVTTIAGVPRSPGQVDGTGDAARVTGHDIVAEPAGNVFLADRNVIRHITPEGVVTTFAGAIDAAPAIVDGPRPTARFQQLSGITRDAAGNLFVLDAGRIRRVSAAGEVLTLAGPETGAPGLVQGLVVDAAGNLFIGAFYAIYRYSPAGVFTLLAGSERLEPGGTDGTGSAARFSGIQDLALDAAGNVLVQEFSRVRMVTPEGVVTTVPTTGRFGKVAMQGGIVADPQGNVFIAEDTSITRIDANGAITAWAGNPLRYGDADGPAASATFTEVQGLAADPEGTIYVGEASLHRVRTIRAGQVATLAQLPLPDVFAMFADRYWLEGVAVDSGGNVYAAQKGFSTVRKIAPDGTVRVLPGVQPGSGEPTTDVNAAQLMTPWGVAVDADDSVYIADTGNHVVRKVTPAGVGTVLAGAVGEKGTADGKAGAARFDSPVHIAVDGAGNVFVADYGRSLRRISPAGDVVTLGAMWASAIAADAAGNLYVAETSKKVIWKITPAGESRIVAGTPGGSGLRMGPLPGTFAEIKALAVVPSPPGTIGTQLAVASEAAILLVTLPE